MADAHHDDHDPNAAPERLLVKPDFSTAAYVFAFGLGAIAIAAGIIAGLAFTVD